MSPERKTPRGRTRLAAWIDRLQPTEPAVLAATAVAVALLTAAGVLLFQRMVALARGAAGALPLWLAPIAGGAFVGLLARFLIRRERHHGVAGVMEAVALGGGRLRWWRMPQKAVGAAASIGSGASVGPEDPSVQIGASLGSMLGQAMRLSDDRVRTLVAAGAAGGVSAAFNAPIAGVFFALEVILGELAGRALGVVVLASVASAALARGVGGARAEFEVVHYAIPSAGHLPLYLALGLLAGVVAAAYIRGFDLFHEAFRRLRAPTWTKPAIAGAVVGLLALRLPEVRGVGYESVGRVLAGEGGGGALLLALLLGKLLATPLCVSAGFIGGVFAPALFLGAMLGGAFGGGLAGAAPALGADPSSFAMAGMAAVLAGAVRCPLTATLLLFEMTNDFRVILPVLLAVVTAQWVASRLQRESVYTAALARKGIRLERGRDVDVLESVTVGDVMRRDTPTVSDAATLAEAADALARAHLNGLPVLDAGGDLCGVVTVGDLERARSDELAPGARVGDVCTRELLVAHPEETIGAALRRMAARDVGRLPVVDRQAPRRLLGVLRRVDLVRAYDAALVRRAAARQRAEQARLGILGDVEVEEVVVAADAPCAGRRMAEVHWPAGCVVATIRRRHRLLVPRGDTRVEPGDVLLLVADGDARAEALRLCGGGRR